MAELSTTHERGVEKLNKLHSFLITPENEHLYQNWSRLFDLVKNGRHNYLGKPPIKGAWASDPNELYGLPETGFLPTLEEIQQIVKMGATLYGHIETTTGWIEIVHTK